MKVIFRQTVPNVAREGDIKEVSDGYARNYLFPKNLAAPATAERLSEKVSAEKRTERHKKDVEKNKLRIASDLQGKHFRFAAKANEHGTLFAAVTPAQITAILLAGGYEVSPTAVVSRPIKVLGDHEVEFQFGTAGRATIILSVVSV